MRRDIEEQFMEIRAQIAHLNDRMMSKNYVAAEAEAVQAREMALIREEQQKLNREIMAAMEEQSKEITRRLTEMKDMMRIQNDAMVCNLRARIEKKMSEEKLSSYDLLELSEAAKHLIETEQKLKDVYRELPY